MNHTLRTLGIAALSILPLTTLSLAAHAAPVTFISGSGTNSGTCNTPATACRTLSFALGQTNPGGTVRAIDAANYGSATVTQSVNIIGVPGAELRRNTAGDALNIAVAPTDVVTIQGFLIDGSSKVATNGILMSTGGTLHVLNCTITNFSNTAINLNPDAALEFLIQDTTTVFNGNETIRVRATGAATARGVLVRVTSSNNGFAGMRVLGPGSDVTVSFSTFTGNNADGILVGAGTGVEVGGIVRIMGSTLTRGSSGIRIIAGSTVFSAGDNLIDGNTTNINTSGGGTFTSVGRQ